MSEDRKDVRLNCGFRFDGTPPSCPPKSSGEQRHMLAESEWIGGANIRTGEIWLERQEFVQRGPAFCSRLGRDMPEGSDQAMVRTNIIWLAENRLPRSGNRTVDVAEQKARER